LRLYHFNCSGIESSIYVVPWARLCRHYCVEIVASKVLGNSH
jgi:hypothetical protein